MLPSLREFLEASKLNLKNGILIRMTFRSWPISLITLAVVVLVATGAPLLFHSMDKDGQMTNCTFMGTPAICNMSAQEHISAWQRMFSNVPAQILLLLSLLLLVVRPLFRYLTYKPPQILYFQPKEKFTPVFNHLQEAFSSGLINSKAY